MLIVLLLCACFLVIFLITVVVLAYLVIITFIRKYRMINDSESVECNCLQQY